MRRTPADRLVVPHVALGPVGALAVPEAGVDAARVHAGVLARAVAVAEAADDLAADLGVAVVTGAAATVGHVVDHVALGSGPAEVRHEARVDAGAVDTGPVLGALGVPFAAQPVAAGLGVALVAGLARAGCPVVLHVADSVGTTVAGVAALAVHAGLALTAVVVCRADAAVLELNCGREKIVVIWGFCVTVGWSEVWGVTVFRVLTRWESDKV